MDDLDYSAYDSNDDIGLEPEDRALIRTRKPWYKAEKGRVDRVAFLYFNTVDKAAVSKARREMKSRGEELTKEQTIAVAKKALENRAKSLNKSADELVATDLLQMDELRFKKLVAHYCEGPQIKGYIVSRLGLDGPEADKVWRKLPEPNVYLTTLLLIYPTMNRESADVDKNRLLSQWIIMPWRFREERYDQIFKRSQSLKSNDVSIATQDIGLECKDTTFQNITVDPLGPAVYLRHPELKSLVLSKAVDMYKLLNPFREMSTEDLKVKLGIGSAPSISSAVDTDFDNVLNNL